MKKKTIITYFEVDFHYENGSHEKETAARQKYTLYCQCLWGQTVSRPTGNSSLPDAFEDIIC